MDNFFLIAFWKLIFWFFCCEILSKFFRIFWANFFNFSHARTPDGRPDGRPDDPVETKISDFWRFLEFIFPTFPPKIFWDYISWIIFGIISVIISWSLYFDKNNCCFVLFSFYIFDYILKIKLILYARWEQYPWGLTGVYYSGGFYVFLFPPPSHYAFLSLAYY